MPNGAPTDTRTTAALASRNIWAQQSSDPYDPDCGNGVKTDGSNVTGNNPTDTSVAITSTFVAEWVAHLKTKYGTAANGGVQFYNLDNEPMLWNSTHRDVHPQPTSYDEMRDKTWHMPPPSKRPTRLRRRLARCCGAGWRTGFRQPTQAGGGAWWDARPDRKAHGDVPFAPWYLQQMKAYEQANGKRILDYFDLHYYPQANGVSLAGAGDAATQALRLRSTRSLWDGAYADESWIKDTEGGPAVRLIPRMRDWVSANYPGTKLAMTEYNWGALDHINGALAQADVLGIFGREGLDLATLWSPPTTAQPGAYAFRVYRNYDGAGSKFGETSVSATSANQDQLSIYAAQRSSDNAVTLLVINKTTSAITSDVTMTGATPTGAARVFRYSAANLSAIVKEADQAVNASGFSATFPANSITVFVLKVSAPPTATPNPNVTPRVQLPTVTR